MQRTLMESVAMIVYELATALLPVAAAYALVRAHGRRTATRTARVLPVCMFALYLAGVLYVTGAGTLFDLLRLGIDGSAAQMSLVPFFDSDVMMSVLNVVLFLPMGFLVPLVSRCDASAAAATAFGFAFSLAVEASQLLNNRTTDIDDLLLNTLGTLIGFALMRAANKLAAHPSKHSREDVLPFLHGMPLDSGRFDGIREAALYAGAAFAGHFLLFNELGAASLLYGF